MIRFVLILIFILFSSTTFAQERAPITLDKKSKSKIQKAQQLSQSKKFDDALKLFGEVLEKYPDLLKIRQQVASIHLETKNYDAAIEQLTWIDNKLEKANPSILLTLADIYEFKQDFNAASKALEKLEAFEFRDKRIEKLYLRRIKEVKFRAEAYQNPVPFDPTPMGEEINTNLSEYLPSFNADGSVLVYTKRKQNTRGFAQQEDLFISYKNEDGSFTPGVPITDLNTSQNEGAHTFSQDGKVLIFTACDRRDSYGGCDLYISFFKNGRWGQAVNMGENINTRFWESQPVLSADNKKLFFSSTRSGGFGKSDIWMVELGANGWGEAINLGNTINTNGNEGSPFFHPDNRSLYFRSDGHIGLGDFDLFLSRLSENKWSTPENMGYPINSSKSEGALFVELNGSRAYYTSDQHTDGEHLDILYFDLPNHLKPFPTRYIKIRAVDAITGKGIAAELELLNLTDNSIQLKKVLDKNGESLSTITLGHYALHLSHPDYIFHSENIALEKQGLKNQDAFVFEIKLQKIESIVEKESKPKEIILKNIFFESGSALLLSSSEYEIQTLYNLLIENPDMKITITGHTDDIGEIESNQRLSEERAKAVFESIIKKGIDPSRVSYLGKGESEPIADNNTEEGRKQNRRTVFTINPS